MNHFSDEDWLDYVREVMPASRRSAVEQHLQSGCSECMRRRRFWENVRNAAMRDASSEAPPHVVRAGESAFAEWRLKSFLPAHAKRARPVFDSLLEPLPAGVRAVAQPPRRILQRWGQWTVDLRIESESGGRVSLTGQVLNPAWRPEEGSRTEVLLVSQGAPVAATDVNQFGEFQFTFLSVPDLVIYIAVRGKQVIAVSLPDPDQPLPLKKRNPGV